MQSGTRARSTWPTAGGDDRHTSIEATARFDTELGYHVTLITDATAAVEQEVMHATHEVDGPRLAHAILTTAELPARLPS